MKDVRMVVAMVVLEWLTNSGTGRKKENGCEKRNIIEGSRAWNFLRAENKVGSQRKEDCRKGK